MRNIDRKTGLSSFQLKCIAILSMLIDHTGAVIFPSEIWLRCIGRLAFPIFCFLIVEGSCYTHDIRRYLIRLGLFAMISEIPYDLAFNGDVLEFTSQNVFFTLFFGVGMLMTMRYCRNWPEKVVILLIAMWISVVFKCDYSYRGILLIFVFYVFRRNRALTAAAGALWNFLYQGYIQIYGIWAMIPITLYNGEEGKKMKAFFYLFYPVHLLVLCLIRFWILWE